MSNPDLLDSLARAIYEAPHPEGGSVGSWDLCTHPDDRAFWVSRAEAAWDWFQFGRFER